MSACTCGTHFGRRNTALPGEGDQPMEASFIHLPPSLWMNNNHDEEHSVSGTHCHSSDPSEPLTPENFIKSQDHLLLLEQVANGQLEDISLCMNCLERIRLALDQDTDRLQRECRMYEQTMKYDALRQESTMRAIRGYWPSLDEHSNPQVDTHTLVQGYRDEIEAMQRTCDHQRQELQDLIQLRREQARIAKELDEYEWGVEEHKNALALEGRGFDNAEEQVWKKLSSIVEELEQLSSVQIKLPAMVLDLQVDKARGLRYPLINELRIAYRPKGDLAWNEIQAAWSLAAQLLLACGALLHYPSQYWKIVPLSSGAKLIHHENVSGRENDFKVYNLGHPAANGPQSLLAWNNLMFGVIQHASKVLKETLETEDAGASKSTIPKLPYDVTPTSVGGISLLQLDGQDDGGWSRSIHCMCCNLLWLSECASRVALSEVTLEAQV